MKPKACEQEEAVVRAVVDGTWSDRLEQHAASCDRCRDVAATTRWMRALGTGDEAPLPDASLVWVRAQVEADLASRERGFGPTGLWSLLGQVAMALTGAVALALLWDRLRVVVAIDDVLSGMRTGLDALSALPYLTVWLAAGAALLLFLVPNPSGRGMD